MTACACSVRRCFHRFSSGCETLWLKIKLVSSTFSLQELLELDDEHFPLQFLCIQWRWTEHVLIVGWMDRRLMDGPTDRQMDPKQKLSTVLTKFLLEEACSLTNQRHPVD